MYFSYYYIVVVCFPVCFRKKKERNNMELGEWGGFGRTDAGNWGQNIFYTETFLQNKWINKWTKGLSMIKVLRQPRQQMSCQ